MTLTTKFHRCKTESLALCQCVAEQAFVIIITRGDTEKGKARVVLSVNIASECIRDIAVLKCAAARAGQTKASLRGETWRAMEEPVAKLLSPSFRSC